jgi:hypothetical protein
MKGTEVKKTIPKKNNPSEESEMQGPTFPQQRSLGQAYLKGTYSVPYSALLGSFTWQGPAVSPTALSRAGLPGRALQRSLGQAYPAGLRQGQQILEHNVILFL